MKWSPEAEAAVKNVPFFVRKKVRTRVEEEARSRGRDRVTLVEVKAAQARFLKRMDREVQGYRVEACFGRGGCPHRIQDSNSLVEQIEGLFKEADLLGFLRRRVGGGLKFHHEFRLALADCPNACSQPQIRDVGVIGAVDPKIGDEPCSLCGACEEACKEGAVRLADEAPEVDMALCLSCGQCTEACPTGAIEREKAGYRVLLGGKLGRHPRLAVPLPGRYTETQVLDIVQDCISVYKARSRGGERFSEILQDEDIERLYRKYPGI